MTFRILLFLLVSGISCQALAADVYVVANPDLALTAADVRDVFTGDKQFSGSVKIVPVDNTSIQNDFLAKALQLNTDKYTGLWTKKSFRDGVAVPAMKSSDAEVISFVKATPGGIGYISSPASGVKVIQKY